MLLLLHHDESSGAISVTSAAVDCRRGDVVVDAQLAVVEVRCGHGRFVAVAC